jgi:aspartate dehydrogenase
MRLGVIGYGAVAQALIARLGAVQITQAVILIRSGNLSAPSGPLRLRSVVTLDALLQTRPDLIVECAGHSAVIDHAEACLRAGTSFVALSLGAFADQQLLDRVRAAAADGCARLIRPSGAIAGIDLIEALSLEGEVHVAYTGTKPPRALRDTPAEQTLDLSALSGPTVYFDGSARDAATLFPRNTNVVAALALAGPGFGNVSVRLVADPDATTNRHAYTVTAAACQASFTIESAAAEGNPRSSLTTVYSLLREIAAFAEQRGTGPA